MVSAPPPRWLAGVLVVSAGLFATAAIVGATAPVSVARAIDGLGLAGIGLAGASWRRPGLRRAGLAIAGACGFVGVQLSMVTLPLPLVGWLRGMGVGATGIPPFLFAFNHEVYATLVTAGLLVMLGAFRRAGWVRGLTVVGAFVVIGASLKPQLHLLQGHRAPTGVEATMPVYVDGAVVRHTWYREPVGKPRPPVAVAPEWLRSERAMAEVAQGMGAARAAEDREQGVRSDGATSFQGAVRAGLWGIQRGLTAALVYGRVAMLPLLVGIALLSVRRAPVPRAEWVRGGLLALVGLPAAVNVGLAAVAGAVLPEAAGTPGAAAWNLAGLCVVLLIDEAGRREDG